MRLAVAAITFAVTACGLFLVENYKTHPLKMDYAQIVQNLETPLPSASLSTTPSPSQIKKLPQKSKPISITPTPTPIPKIHVYYTSSSSRAKYYYCDTDTAWKNLSKENLKQFPSPNALLVSYPGRALHEPCK